MMKPLIGVLLGTIFCVYLTELESERECKLLGQELGLPSKEYFGIPCLVQTKARVDPCTRIKGCAMRRRKKKSTDSENPVDKARKLIELALDESTTLDERESAALKAVKIIDKYNLLDGPLDGLLGQGSTEIAQAAADVVQGGKQVASWLKRLQQRR